MAESVVDMASDWPKLLAILAATTVAAPVAERGVTRLLDKIEHHSIQKKEEHNWIRLVERYPELANEDYSSNRQMFATLHELFPKLADKPEAIIGVMRIAKDYSTGGIDPATLQALARAQSDYANTMRQAPPGSSSNAQISSLNTLYRMF
jgi:hypothetical protein